MTRPAEGAGAGAGETLPAGAPAPLQPVLDVSVVALGGGHGLHASLSALRRVVRHLTAVVTVADNGGSSGRLRQQFDVLPPGDLRMALAALCGDDEWGRTWAQVLQHRFAGDGEMREHVVGNLLIVGLWELLGDPVPALDWVGRLLGAQGRVLPMSTTPMDITAEVRGLDPDDPDALSAVRGQVQVARTGGEIVGIALEPAGAPATPEAVAAVQEADWVVLGPGSWYSSVIPHLVLDEMREALIATRARLVVVLNLESQEGETDGYGPAEHLATLLDHAPGLTIHTVLADRGSVARAGAGSGRGARELRAVVARAGARLVLDDIARTDGSPRHDLERLAVAYARVLAEPASEPSTEPGTHPATEPGDGGGGR